MTVNEFASNAGLIWISGEQGGERPVTGGYVGDLLSWVMSRAGSGSAWMTIMSNTNVAAVAMLADVSCVILSENVSPDEGLLSRARAEELCLLKTPMSSYEVAALLSEALKG